MGTVRVQYRLSTVQYVFGTGSVQLRYGSGPVRYWSVGYGVGTVWFIRGRYGTSPVQYGTGLKKPHNKQAIKLWNMFYLLF